MLYPALTRRETIWGWAYLIFQMTFLPTLLTQGNSRLTAPLSSSQLNFLFFLLNFLAVILIFHRYLKLCLKTVKADPGRFFKITALGFLFYLLCTYCFQLVLGWLRPQFINLNDQAVGAMAGREYLLMAMGTVILVPLAEECFYRGLIFGPLYEKSRILSYSLSASLFSLIHILGFLGVYQGPDLLLSFLQYLPAGLILAYAYRKSGTLFAPVLIHALVNLRGIWLMR